MLPQINRVRAFGYHLLTTSLLLLMAIGCARKPSEAIKIGVILPLTGDGASLGVDCRNGIELALEKLPVGDKARVTLSFEDSRGEPTSAVSALKRLEAVGVKVVIGDLFSAPTLAMAPLAERDAVFIFSPGASNPKLSGASRYVFRNYPSDNFEGKLIAKYIHQRALSKVAILYVNNDYGVGLKDVFSNQFKELGGVIQLSEGYADTETDFRAALTKISSRKVDALYLPGYYTSVARIAIQARELGLSQPLFSNVGVEDPKLLQLGGTAVDGLTYTAPAVDLAGSDPQVMAFANGYRSHFQKAPGFPAAHGFDTAEILFAIVLQHGFDPDSIRAALLSKQFQGVTGPMRFDSNGDVSKPFVIKVVDQGAFRQIGAVEP